ncbi:MAG: hypothetical protein ACLQJR_17215 [Stellaceae bacterium]
MSDERASGFFTRTQTANVHGDSQQVHDALRAAQALFKPKVQAGSVEAQLPRTDGPAPTAQPTQRKARILMASQEVPAPRKPEIAATLPIEGQGAVKKQPAAEIPASDYGRVRALAKYGMTVEQVAGSYEVTVDEVRRIIRT